jgi:hypothetical protein
MERFQPGLSFSPVKRAEIALRHVVTMLFQQLVNKIFCNRFVASLLTSCGNAVPTTW